MTVFVDKIKFIIAGATALVFLLLSILFLLMHFWILGGIALAGMVIYIVLTAKNGSRVHVSDERLEVRLLWTTQLTVNWCDIREVGICGTKILKAAGSKWSGARYVYFSKTKMDDEERFNMCLEWPPKDKVYFRFNYKRIKKIIRIWGPEIVQYNTKNLNIYD